VAEVMGNRPYGLIGPREWAGAEKDEWYFLLCP
jgi:hypothetical protein